MSSRGRTHQLRSLLVSAMRWPAMRPPKPLGFSNWLRQPDFRPAVGTSIADDTASAFFMIPLPNDYVGSAPWVQAFYVCKHAPSVAGSAHPASLSIRGALARMILYHI